MKKIVFTFGRYNPPTTGHAELITYAVKLAHRNGAEHRIYTSQSHDSSKNPLSPREKMAFLRQIFPGVNFVDDPKMKTAFAICKKLADEGYDDVTFVVGEDRVNEFRTQLGKYVKPRTAKDFDPKKNYPFNKFQVVSSGGRKEGISGTALRAAVRKGDFATFAKASAAKDRTLARKIFTVTKKNLAESLLEEKGISRKDFHDKLMSFIDFTCNHLGIDEKPTIQYKEDGKEGHQPSFASYSPGDKVVSILTKNRHPMDVFRSVAHELVHHKQNLDGRLGKNIAKEGATGSKIENEANSEAGKVMRYFGRENPFYFDMTYVTEQKAIILAGTPGSGKDKILKEAILPFGFKEVNADEFHKFDMKENVVVNGTSNYDRVAVIKEALELHGYKTTMVFVNTSDIVSKQRNEARGSKGGRVITETVRFAKWQDAQINLDKFDNLFEKVIEVKNDLDLNLSEQVIQETHRKLIDVVSKEIEQFTLNEADRKFENMLNEVGGAGNWGTSQLTDRYKADTPGQEPGGFKQMKVLRLKGKMKKEDNVKVYGKLPDFGDRLGATAGSAKNPSFVGDITADSNPFMANEPIARWMVKEETKRRFKEKYGKLAEQKIRETAERLMKAESLTDPYTGGMSDVAVTGGPADNVRPDINAEYEKTSLFKKRKQLNNRRK
jgi:predicted ABC-type ATPase